MATSSDVNAGLDKISTQITTARLKLSAAVTNIKRQETELAAIPSTFSDVRNTINAYTPAGAFETLAQDELAKLTTEFQALLSDVSLAVVDLENRTEF